MDIYCDTCKRYLSECIADPQSKCGAPAQQRAYEETQSLRRDVERLTAERDIHALNVKLANERAVAAEAERDAAYAASLRSDEVHSEAMRAVRARAEKAEAERDEARGQVERLRGALDLADAALRCSSCAEDSRCYNGHGDIAGVIRAALADAAGEEE